MKDLYHNLAVNQLLNPSNSNGVRTSASIDLQGYNSASILFSVGQSGDTLSGSVYWTLKMQHSDDDSAFSDVPLADMLNNAATYVIDSSSKDKQAYSLGYAGAKRYLRGIATPTGTHTVGTVLGVTALRSDAGYRPVV